MFSSNTSSAAGDANFVEDVFSTWLYTGTGAAQTITNGIDLSTKGGLVWIKERSGSQDHTIFDTARGVNNYLRSNSSGAQNPGGTYTDLLTAFNATGFSLGADASTAGFVNGSGSTYASWTFRKQPKFFDVVTYTGTGSNRTIAHNLGSVPGCIIVKCTSNASTEWFVYHRSLTSANYHIRLDQTNAEISLTAAWNDTPPTSSVFTLGTDDRVNGSGRTYVAYLFAHNAGGFGLTGTDNVISCGSFTSNASDIATVDLGFEPQFVMMKSSSATGHWWMADNMRGFTVDGENYLRANSDGVEAAGTNMRLTNTGFYQASTTGAATTYIYIAIRRGPMKVPTTGTSVFSPLARTGTGASATVTGVGFAPDLVVPKAKSNNSSIGWWDRLRGPLRKIISTGTEAEISVVDSLTGFDVMDGFKVGPDGSYDINYTVDYINWCFKRAPGFFDEVCYTGTSANTTQAHNLGAVPELIIVKARSNTTNWYVYVAALGNNAALELQDTSASGPGQWNTTSPTTTVFSLGTGSSVNGSGYTYVAYLFATCPGVSKVGSYTGTGTTLQINCGFTAGSRFVLIKRTDSTGAWYVWDSARGIVAGNDPYLLLNSTAAEVTSTDYVDTFSSGFEISSTAPAAINASGGTFIFLAIA
jgi:hypothetical protein